MQTQKSDSGQKYQYSLAHHALILTIGRLDASVNEVIYEVYEVIYVAAPDRD